MHFAAFRPALPLGLSLGAALACVIAFTAPANAETGSQCARYGADYVAVAGSNGCVRIGGHVRVDIARAPVAAMGYAPVSDGVQRASVQGGYYPSVAPFGLTDLFPR